MRAQVVVEPANEVYVESLDAKSVRDADRLQLVSIQRVERERTHRAVGTAISQQTIHEIAPGLIVGEQDLEGRSQRLDPLRDDRSRRIAAEDRVATEIDPRRGRSVGVVVVDRAETSLQRAVDDRSERPVFVEEGHRRMLT